MSGACRALRGTTKSRNCQQVERAKAPKPLERAIRIGQLLDLYGSLLTDRQREFVTLHYGDDLSFGEISEQFQVTRQAVHDAVKHAEAALEDYESKLGFLARGGDGVAPPPAPAGPASPPAATRGNLAEAVERLAAIRRTMLNAGGLLYNVDQLAAEVGAVIDLLNHAGRECDSPGAGA
jgi:predicted DNA-binding protein YlxM (UPF0122 family)